MTSQNKDNPGVRLPDGSPMYDTSNFSTSRSSSNNYLAKIVGFILVIVFFVVANVVFIGLQNLWHSGDQSKLDIIKQELQTKNTAIDALESNITREKSAMNQELATNNTDKYNTHVDDYNTMVNEYKTDIASYNQLVKQANDLSEKVGSTWYVVPIPK
ncbi:MAG TPA: hypothetical protein VMR41_05185 [Patescibacteria group bacterium]|nr:hypothetical protein [Patescibacteria group bacterium]